MFHLVNCAHGNSTQGGALRGQTRENPSQSGDYRVARGVLSTVGMNTNDNYPLDTLLADLVRALFYNWTSAIDALRAQLACYTRAELAAHLVSLQERII